MQRVNRSGRCPAPSGGVIAGVLVLALVACQKESRPIARTDTGALGAVPTAAPSDSAFSRVARIAGFDVPESAVYDSTRDLWYVSNIVGDAATKDHAGYISRLTGDGTIDSLKFIDSGRGGVVLDAPKGLALHGDTLWVADIDVARAFDARTGAPLATVRFSPTPKMLNAIAVGPDGAIYITDTAIETGADGQPKHVGPDRVYRIGPGRKPSVAVQNDALEGPNGITWDAANGRFVVVAFMGKTIDAWKPGTASVQQLATGPGKFDGAQMLSDGRLLVSSWADSSLYMLRDGRLTKVVSGGLPTPADLHVDSRRMRVFIPLSSANRIEVYSIPRTR